MRRFASPLLASLLLATLSACQSAPSATESAAGTRSGALEQAGYDRSEAARLEALFAEAAADADVPVSVLKALAALETGMRPVVREAEPCGDEYSHGEMPALSGVMGLRERAPGATISAAASASGLPEAAVVALPEANVAAAAALLRELAGPSARRDVPEDWWEAVAAWSGLEGPAADAYAADVMEMLLAGERVQLLDGSHVMIEAARSSALEVRIGAARGMVPPSTDYGPAAYTAACSSNYTSASRGKGDIKYVIIHTVQGSYSGAISWFANCSSQVSAHYTVRSKDGAITQSVLEKHIGWHAGNWTYNEQSIGIEHEGYVSDASWYTDAMYQASAKLTAAICDKYGIPKDRNHIIGHFEVPGCSNPGGGGKGCHTDPGGNWNWNKYMAYVKGEGGGTPQPTTGVLKGFIREGDVFSGPNISGATVELNTGKTATTAGDGVYSFTLAPGTYTVTASAPGYKSKSEDKVVEAGIDNWKSMALAKDDTPPPPPPDPEPDAGSPPEPEPDAGSPPEPEPDAGSPPEPEPDVASGEPVGVGGGHWEPETPGGDDFKGFPGNGQPVSIGPGHWAPGNAGYAPEPTGGGGDGAGSGGGGGAGGEAPGDGAGIAPAASSGCQAAPHAAAPIWLLLLLALPVLSRRRLPRR